MVLYKILWKKSAEKDLKNIPHKLINRIIEVIDSLSKNPLPPRVRKITGSVNLYRLRIGDYRIIYEVNSNIKNVMIIYIRNRKDVYK
ncbi:MAG: type II toxin-antitoxin system RelE family toxin [Atribacter sp.]|jgi:mRNA interferase RelE/StbE|uniref:Toxin RelG n=1 Tax=Atribacter laminatus TaxID=2847778 RepID=A0A7T1AM14_ATRLM|nr:type II toxin-antitoxin system RelE/ParE family toxin [Thermotogaceae bacterium]QPM68406.1 Toxin RelG [Atribacter laminatus]